ASELRAADEEARDERVAGSGRVHHLAGERRHVLVADREASRAALDDPNRRSRVAPERLPLLLVPEDDVRPEALEPFPQAASGDRRPRREVDAEPTGAKSRGRLGRLGDRARQEAVAREVEPVAVGEPGGVELVGPELRRDAAVGG